MKKKILFVLLFLTIPVLIYAHQPRLVEQETIKVENPEISQAFYGRLSGTEHYYKIESDQPFNLYVSLLIPENEKKKTEQLITVSGEIIKDNEVIFKLEPENASWEKYYEEFAGDYYYEGPEIEQQVETGLYIVKVFNENNQGDYVFVVGKKEEFPANEILNTIKTLPQIKKEFFGKSPFSAFLNKIGLFIFGPIIILLIIIIFIIIYIRRKKVKNFDRIK